MALLINRNPLDHDFREIIAWRLDVGRIRMAVLAGLVQKPQQEVALVHSFRIQFGDAEIIARHRLELGQTCRGPHA